jgi:cytoskeletal protein RodZ
MHIDHSQFIELLVETSGIEQEKVEKQIGELIAEIEQAVSDGEAYEIEGFGIFSGIGGRVIFMPSGELETEINFKYVGMEPIEMEGEEEPEEPADEEDPFEGLQMDDDTGKRDPFTGLIEELDEDEIPEEAKQEEAEEGQEDDSDEIFFGVPDDDEDEEIDFSALGGSTTNTAESEEEADDVEEEEPHPGPEEWGIDSHKESDKSASRLFSSLMGEEASDDDEDDSSFEDIFGEEEEAEEETEEAEEETEEVAGEESVSGLYAKLSDAGDEVKKVSSEELEAGMVDDDEDSMEDDLAASLNKSLDDIDEDFDDPFANIDEDDEEDETEDILPVITNISSDLPEPEPKKEEEKPKKEKKKKKQPKPKKEKSNQAAPAWLWVVLIIVVLGGSIVGLGYFSIINIPGITPQVASTQPITPPAPVQQTPPPTQQPAEQTEQPTEQQPVVAEEQTTQPDPTNQAEEAPVQEQPVATQVPVNTASQTPEGQSKYGLMGVATTEANDGYTIVMYSLSIEENAYAQRDELAQSGYRALVTPVPSQQYGTLWRVSIGQFASLRDAAIGAEDLDETFTQNFFIKKITN